VITSVAVSIAAPPAVIFALARNPSRWAALLPHYRVSRPTSSAADGSIVVLFVAVPRFGPWGMLGLPVAWRARTWSDPTACRLRFVHVGGATRGMSVTWTIEASGVGSRVTIHHHFAAPWPWAAFIDRWFTRPIATRTLSTFRVLAESVHESAIAAPANHPV